MIKNRYDHLIIIWFFKTLYKLIHRCVDVLTIYQIEMQIFIGMFENKSQEFEEHFNL